MIHYLIEVHCFLYDLYVHVQFYVSRTFNFNALVVYTVYTCIFLLKSFQ